MNFKIVDIGEGDAFFERKHDFIGKTVRVKFPNILYGNGDGYVCGYLDVFFSSPTGTRIKCMCFAKVKLEECSSP
jgi:hypothetical protein